MRCTRLLLTLTLAALLSGVALLAERLEPAGTQMCAAGEKFLASLTPEQKAKALLAFDSQERTNWHFTPQQDKQRRPTRKGLSLEEMTEAQRRAAMDLLRGGTSPSGYTTATTIMSLESILRDLEKRGDKEGAMVRNPQWYFFAVFGEPSAKSRWGWRVEGHHLALNFVVDNGKVSSATPAFFGANPAAVKKGPREGLRTLPEAEDLAFELFNSLDEDQKKAAYQEKNLPEIGEAKPAPNVGEPKGLPAAKMTEKQRDILMQLLKAYAGRMPADIGAAELQQLQQAGIDKIHFLFAGGTRPGEPHTYRIHGPTFVVEFLNVQADSAGNKANHIHSSWRHPSGDFGLTAK